MTKKQSGFGVIEGLLVVVIVGLLGGVGWYVYDSQKEANDSLNNAANTEQQTAFEKAKKKVEEKPKDVTESWATFTPNSKLYTIKLPDGWTFLHQNDECDCLYSKTTKYKQGIPAKIETTQGGRDGIFGYFIVTDDEDSSGERFQGYKKQGAVKVGNLEGYKYYYEQTEEPDGIGLDEFGIDYSYYFAGSNKWIYLSYSINPGDTNNKDLFEKSVKTLHVN